MIRLPRTQLFSDPKQTLTFETRDLFSKIRAVDADAADQYLEGAVLQERDTVSQGVRVGGRRADAD